MSIMFSLVNRAEGYNGGSGTTIDSAAFVATAGNFMCAFVSKQSTGVATVTDTAGNTWIRAGTSATQGANNLDIYYAYNILGHATNVVNATWAGAGGYRNIMVRQFTGIERYSDPLVDSDETTGAGTSMSGAALESKGLYVLIYAGMENDGFMVSAGSGYTMTIVTDGIGGYEADEYGLKNSNAAATSTGGSASNATKSASFKTINRMELNNFKHVSADSGISVTEKIR